LKDSSFVSSIEIFRFVTTPVAMANRNDDQDHTLCVNESNAFYINYNALTPDLLSRVGPVQPPDPSQICVASDMFDIDESEWFNPILAPSSSRASTRSSQDSDMLHRQAKFGPELLVNATCAGDLNHLRYDEMGRREDDPKASPSFCVYTMQKEVVDKPSPDNSTSLDLSKSLSGGSLPSSLGETVALDDAKLTPHAPSDVKPHTLISSPVNLLVNDGENGNPEQIIHLLDPTLTEHAIPIERLSTHHEEHLEGSRTQKSKSNASNAARRCRGSKDINLLGVNPKKTRRPARFDKPVPSRFCHICSRTPKNVQLAVCSNIKEGTCRKVTCLKCFDKYDLGPFDQALLTQTSSWKCPHCIGACPPRAQCRTYQRINDRLRLDRLSQARPKLGRRPRSSSRRDNSACLEAFTEPPLLPNCLEIDVPPAQPEMKTAPNDEISVSFAMANEALFDMLQ